MFRRSWTSCASASADSGQPFNVHQYRSNLPIVVGDYEDHAVRPFALGEFRDLLSVTLHHPAMPRYLDAADNEAGHINENYAREVMDGHDVSRDRPENAQMADVFGHNPKRLFWP
jgi:uncharacterized protein (DUF1800 family)